MIGLIYFEILIYPVLFCWFLHIARRTFFSLYFWQLKEYRVDRFWSSVKENKAIVFPKIFFIPVFLLASLLVFQKTECNSIWEIAAFLFYLLFGLYSLFLLLRKKWRFPKFTGKMAVLCVSVFLAEIILAAFFIEEFVFFALFLEIVFVLFISLFVGIMQLPVFLMKKSIEKKAGTKIQQLKNLTIVGITGSFGKTSTKEFLYTLLSSKYNCLKTEGNINTKIGIAQFILKNLKDNHRVFICEMGAYKIGEIRDICEMVKPKIGILTGINQQHVDLFGSQENIIKAKYELIESLPKDGTAIFNGDNSYCRGLYQKTSIPKRISCASAGTAFGCDIEAKNIRVERDFVCFDAIDKNGKSDYFKVNVFGSQNIQNILMAILGAKEMGMSGEEIVSVVQTIKPEQGGTKHYGNKNGINIIDSSYSANPDGVVSVLEYLKTWPQKKVIVMPCLIELGKASREIHRKIGEKISQICDLAIITTKDRFEEIQGGAAKKEKVILIENSKEIINKIKSFCVSGDVVLFEGRVSKNIIESLKN